MFPPVVAVVGEWLLGKPGESVHYGDSRLPREAFSDLEPDPRDGAFGVD